MLILVEKEKLMRSQSWIKRAHSRSQNHHSPARLDGFLIQRFEKIHTSIVLPARWRGHDELVSDWRSKNLSNSCPDRQFAT